MARSKSAVITPAEKKELAKATKVELKEAQAAAKALVASKKAKDKEYAGFIKQHEKDAKAADKKVADLTAKLDALK